MLKFFMIAKVNKIISIETVKSCMVGRILFLISASQTFASAFMYESKNVLALFREIFHWAPSMPTYLIIAYNCSSDGAITILLYIALGKSDIW